MSVLLRIPPLVPPPVPGHGWSPGIGSRPAPPAKPFPGLRTATVPQDVEREKERDKGYN